MDLPDALSVKVNAVLKFIAFPDFVKLKSLTGILSQKRRPTYVIEGLGKSLELTGNLRVDKTAHYADYLQLVYNRRCAIAQDEATHFAAIRPGVTPTLFYGTNGFYKPPSGPNTAPTDGIEYDVYISLSIAPDKTFSVIYQKNLRLLQLTSMAGIGEYTRLLKTSRAIRVAISHLFIQTIFTSNCGKLRRCLMWKLVIMSVTRL